MAKFKIGDQVRFFRCTDEFNPASVPIGATGTIFAIYNNTATYTHAVRVDDHTIETFKADELELVHPIARTHQAQP